MHFSDFSHVDLGMLVVWVGVWFVLAGLWRLYISLEQKKLDTAATSFYFVRARPSFG